MCEFYVVPTRISRGQVSKSRKTSWKPSIIFQQGIHQGLSQRRAEEIKKYKRKKPQEQDTEWLNAVKTRLQPLVPGRGAEILFELM